MAIMLRKFSVNELTRQRISEAETARQNTTLEAVFGFIIAILVVSGCAFLAFREWVVIGNNVAGLLAALLGGLTLLCVVRDVARRQFSLTSWWLLVAAFEVVVCVALA